MKFDDTLLQVVKKDVECGLVPMLLGEPGIGKSSWVEDLGRIMHTKVFVLACNQLAVKEDLTGARLVKVPVTVEKDGQMVNEETYEQQFYPHTVIQQAINYANQHPEETPILFCDELNRTTSDVTSAVLSIPTLRSIGDRPLPSNLKVVTAGNDKGNITSLDTASISRFVLYHVVPDTETFLGLDDNLNQYVRATLEKNPADIFENTPIYSAAVVTTDDDDQDNNSGNAFYDDTYNDEEQMHQITTPRTITAVSNWLNLCTDNDLREYLQTLVMSDDGQQVTMLQEIIEGHVGRTAFAAHLLQEINVGLNSNKKQVTNTIKVTKPACYKNIESCNTQTELMQTIASMSDTDKSNALVYAVFEKQDNAQLISFLGEDMSTLTPDAFQTLMSLITQDTSSHILLDENKEALTDLAENIPQVKVIQSYLAQMNGGLE